MKNFDVKIFESHMNDETFNRAKEELKANNQMEWVQKMNNIKNTVEEIILERYIYN